jgi:hypothetical protein
MPGKMPSLEVMRAADEAVHWQHMTWLDWIVMRLRGAPPPAAPRAVTPIRQPHPRVPAEYLSLYTYLEHRYASTVVLTFDQMESLLGFPLPETARTEARWWTDATLRMDSHSDAWTLAQRTAVPHLTAKTVAFERLP